MNDSNVFDLIEKNISQAEIARQLGIKPMLVSNWKKRGIPANRVLDLERISGISRHLIDPLLYPRDGGYDTDSAA